MLLSFRNWKERSYGEAGIIDWAETAIVTAMLGVVRFSA